MPHIEDSGASFVGSLVVADGEYGSLAERYVSLGDTMEGILDEYIGALTAISDGAIAEGDASANIASFLCLASLLRGQFRSIAAEVSELLATFVDDIDEADAVLYGG